METELKKLVVYYSLTGNTAHIGKTVAEAMGADVAELKLKRGLSRWGFVRYLQAAKQALWKESPELLPMDKDPAAYDVLCIGTPVWAFSFAPPLRTFFETVKVSGKKIALFCSCLCCPGKTLERMKEELAGNDLIGEIVFVKLLGDRENNGEKAVKWARDIIVRVGA